MVREKKMQEKETKIKRMEKKKGGAARKMLIFGLP